MKLCFNNGILQGVFAVGAGSPLVMLYDLRAVHTHAVTDKASSCTSKSPLRSRLVVGVIQTCGGASCCSAPLIALLRTGRSLTIAWCLSRCCIGHCSVSSLLSALPSRHGAIGEMLLLVGCIFRGGARVSPVQCLFLFAVCPLATAILSSLFAPRSSPLPPATHTLPLAMRAFVRVRECSLSVHQDSNVLQASSWQTTETKMFMCLIRTSAGPTHSLMGNLRVQTKHAKYLKGAKIQRRLQKTCAS